MLLTSFITVFFLFMMLYTIQYAFNEVDWGLVVITSAVSTNVSVLLVLVASYLLS